LAEADAADRELARGKPRGPLHGIPFSVKDSIDVAGVRTTAGTWGRRAVGAASSDATLVHRFKQAGAIPIAKTNLPDLLFSFETDNLIFGRSNNPYDPERSPGGSSGGESALIAAGGSPLGLGSDCLGSVRIPAAFCGITSIKPTSGRLPRTGHVPPAGLWFEALWQIGPMARRVEDLQLAMTLLAGEDEADWTSPPVPLLPAEPARRIALFINNGFARCSAEVEGAVLASAAELERAGLQVEEARPPGTEEAYELELALLGADGCRGIDDYLHGQGSDRTHPLLSNFVDRMRKFRADAEQFAARWHQWDQYRTAMRTFFSRFDAVLCPTYTEVALKHGASMHDENFRGFSYTMAWSVAGYPAATVRCGDADGLPINVQVITKPWRDLTALALCRQIEEITGGWKPGAW
jgi:amidase